MKKFFTSTAFYVFTIVSVVVIIFYSVFKLMNSSLKQETKLIKDGITLTVNIQGSTSSSIFDWTNYKGYYATSVKEAFRVYPFDAILNDQAAVTAYADSVFYQETGVKAFASIEITLPENVEKALAAKKIAELELQAVRYQIAKDSLISIAAKKDAQGYTAEAERLENRRDQRLNSVKNRESNERIEIRKAKTLEEAASNVGFLSGDLTVVQK